MSNSTYNIVPIHWGSRGIGIPDWFSEFTLCLSPLIAHILSGAPRPSYLTSNRPKWHDRLCLLNPISIVWRYAAITERRIQTRDWQPKDIAVANAVFWTPRGWDGSKIMRWRAMSYMSYLPQRNRVEFLSLEMLKTIILFLQGVQAVTAILCNYTSTGDFTSFDTISGLFIPLGIAGLLRVFAAPWLTDDFNFGISSHGAERPLRSTNGRRTMPLLMLDDIGYGYGQKEQYQSSGAADGHPWLCGILRGLFMLPVVGSWALSFIYVTPWIGSFGLKGVYTTTGFVFGLYYMFLTTPMLLIIGYYFCKGPLETTIIPCISRVWYKVYCVALTLFTIILVVITAVETRKTVCGKYTSHATGSQHPCATGNTKLIEIGPTSDQGFGIIQAVSGQTVVTNLTGSCIGTLTPINH
ncbi:hypothetical protein PFICI_02581 [Pestalotiopsis fici W106-1]|uniref:Uncharacterized protein n=1 Tax=Pestalotiopsis fici (strain W106-1 / CGMCC3.15140) TaxID=1229662 RepID=W3XH50_PESFW|nr:uncharacterized protein PFICI_02581 [Pestalotiopsis fici W106-1]ETS84556.1 hypothetical protein PFICI_02581 [Pestalotiopsis fici W106-1]